MDWSTSDYTKTYADTLYVPEPDHDAGVYLLDEAGAGPKNSWLGPDPEDAATDSRVRAPLRPAGRAREGFYTGGNIVSDRHNNHAVFDAAWDERPLHYSPSAGPDWAHLVPSPRQRPPGGGPAPSLAFPMITQSEAQVGPKDLFTGGRAPGPGPDGWTPELALQLIKVVLLLVIVVLLALTLRAAGRVARRLKKTTRLLAMFRPAAASGLLAST